MSDSAPTPGYVTDTHAIIFLLQDRSALGMEAARVFAEAELGRAVIHVPTIMLVEVRYKEDKANHVSFKPGVTDRVRRFVDDSPGLVWTSLDVEAAGEIGGVTYPAVKDMPDRIIAATARARGLPLITRDSKIAAWGGVATVW